MDEKALKIVRDYIFAHLDKTNIVPPFDVYMVWKCKALQMKDISAVSALQTARS